VEFCCECLDIEWVAVVLKTAAKNRGFQRISIHVPRDLPNVVSEQEWARTLCSDWDLLLVQFWESHSIRTEIVYNQFGPEDKGKEVADWSVHLFPESSRRGIIDPVKTENENRGLITFVLGYSG
jgi:hypothetical protein